MTAWEIKYYILACDHFDQPDVPAILAQGPKVLVTIDFDKPQRCTARFSGAGGESRAAVRKRAVKKGWVHVRKKGEAHRADPEYCPKHRDEGKAEQEKERLAEERFYASLS
jgi:hypothetical protein